VIIIGLGVQLSDTVLLYHAQDPEFEPQNHQKRRTFNTGGVAQAVEYLPKPLNLNPTTAKKKIKFSNLRRLGFKF
jgi:hypothetical protein